jgi:hypothetical protein
VNGIATEPHRAPRAWSARKRRELEAACAAARRLA